MRLIDEEIEIELGAPTGLPVSFRWRGREYKITDVLSASAVADFKRPWYRRRHRERYRVKVETGEIFEIYFHRGPGKKFWVLSREI